MAISPAVMGDFTLSSNTTLTIAADQATSTGTVTIRANNNNVDAPNKMVMSVGDPPATAQGVTDPADVTLTIVDDDPATDGDARVVDDLHRPRTVGRRP